eukprot:6103300-Pyramimonas_sp.AAC.1
MCILCYWCDHAEVSGGDFHTYALPPGLQTGRYSRDLDEWLPCPAMVDEIAYPTTDKLTGVRSELRTTATLLHEALAVAVSKDRDICTVGPDTKLPDVYWDHTLVKRAQRRASDLPLPLAIYTDGVRFSANTSSNPDSVLGFWCTNVLTRKRILITTLRSRGA